MIRTAILATVLGLTATFTASTTHAEDGFNGPPHSDVSCFTTTPDLLPRVCGDVDFAFLLEPDAEGAICLIANNGPEFEPALSCFTLPAQLLPFVCDSIRLTEGDDAAPQLTDLKDVPVGELVSFYVCLSQDTDHDGEPF
jgi:hypothetical protein